VANWVRVIGGRDQLLEWQATPCTHMRAHSASYQISTFVSFSNLLQGVRCFGWKAGALLHVMLPRLASLSLEAGAYVNIDLLLSLAKAAGGALPLHTLHIENAATSAIAPIVGSLRKLSFGSFGSYQDLDSSKLESLLAHAQQLHELAPICAWVSPCLQKLSLTSTLKDCPVLCLRDVLCGNLPALREVQVGGVLLPSLPSTEEGAAAVEVLRTCLASTSILFSIEGIALKGWLVGDEVQLWPWLQPLAELFADTSQAAQVKSVWGFGQCR